MHPGVSKQAGQSFSWRQPFSEESTNSLKNTQNKQTTGHAESHFISTQLLVAIVHASVPHHPFVKLLSRATRQKPMHVYIDYDLPCCQTLAAGSKGQIMSSIL